MSDQNDDGPPPQKWWLTGYMRAMHDFEWLASPEIEGKYFRNEATLTGYVQQLKDLEKRFQVYFALSFVGAAVVLAGGFPHDANVRLFGIDVPANLITLQLIAVFVSGSFVQALRGLGSYVVLNGMIAKLLELIPQGAEFVVARYDASHLWMNLLKRREIGYQSPLYHTVANGLFSLSGLLLLLIHFSIVGAALWKALDAAWAGGAASFAFFISLTASLSFVAATLLFFLGFLIPVPYRASKQMKEFWEKGLLGSDSPPPASKQ